MLTLGSDPEVFVKSRTQKRFVSALDVLGNNKHNPIYTASGQKLYADGLAVEGTVAPAKSKKDFIESIRTFIKETRLNLGEEFELSNTASHIFEPEDFNHPESRVLGCNVAYDVFNVCEVRPIPGSEMDNLRTCGGHLHFSCDEGAIEDYEARENLVKILNLIVGTALNIVDNDPTSPRRKKLYGKAGEFRFTDYGVEMRSPSNYWLGNEELVALVYDLCDFSYHIIKTGRFEEFMNMVDQETLVNAINTFDKAKCRAILEQVKLPENLMEQINNLEQQTISIEQNWK